MMKNWKSLSLVLALPLLLVACDKPQEIPTVEVTPIDTADILEQATEIVEDLGEVIDEAIEVPEIVEETEAIVPEAPAETEVVVETETETEPAPEVEPTPEPVAGLNGTFSYDTQYGTPKGVTPLNTTFVVEDGAIKSFTLSGNPQHQTSIDHQVLFAAEVGQYVLGKKLEDVGAIPQKLNGASLTSTGFKSALQKLMDEA